MKDAISYIRDSSEEQVDSGLGLEAYPSRRPTLPHRVEQAARRSDAREPRLGSPVPEVGTGGEGLPTSLATCRGRIRSRQPTSASGGRRYSGTPATTCCRVGGLLDLYFGFLSEAGNWSRAEIVGWFKEAGLESQRLRSPRMGPDMVLHIGRRRW